MKRLMFLLVTSILASLMLALPAPNARADEPAVAAPAAAPAVPAPAAPVVAAVAPAAAPAAVPADVEKRLADLEAYVTNGARADDKTSKITSPGPGHNGFMMICAALVLFMTLPGLAL